MTKKRIVLADYLNGNNLFYRVHDLSKNLWLNIQGNLHHQLRDYQRQALLNFNWCQHQPHASKKFNQVMFKMATGSGKTDLMAALILYLYATKGYQYFIYVTKSKGVVEKTKDNFINSNSDKYLFNHKYPININGMNIQTVGHLPNNLNNAPQNTIYIDLTTITNLSNQLNNGGDNRLSYSDFEHHKIVILADEAHHFNVSTKQEHAKRKTRKARDAHSWESTLDKLRTCNLQNRQLEFTGTLNYQNDDHLYKKYKNKIIYEYGLKTFINPNDNPLMNNGKGYAKKIFQLETSDNDRIKMINAILLSQYRKEIARKLKILNFKPVILFKSNYINPSKKAEEDFNDLISNLTTRDLLSELKHQEPVTHSSILRDYVYKYWIRRLSSDKIKHTHSTISELQHNFQSDKVIGMNDNSSTDILSDEDNFQKVNSLEDPYNPIRVIFAVAKLTEGWDVLNLYDIVRLKERKSNGDVKKTSYNDSEAQLIGRGSRYYPFKYHGTRTYYRRFDNYDVQHQLLERLYYHTINDNKYLDKLRQGLERKGVPVTDDNGLKPATAKLTKGFLGSRVYNYGNLFENKTITRKSTDMDSFKDYGGIPVGTCQVNMQTGTFEQEDFENQESDKMGVIEPRQVINSENGYLSDDPQLVRKALEKLYYFFNFNNLHRYFEPLKSMYDFIHSSKWLGSIRLIANVDRGSQDFTDKQRKNNYIEYRKCQLKAVVQYFQNQLLPQIRKSKSKPKGTNKFVPVPIKDIVRNYTRQIPKDSYYYNHRDKFTQHIRKYPINKGWFAYDNAIVNQLEYQCICDIGRLVNHFKRIGYKDIYLIRNDEQFTKLTLHDFNKKSQHTENYLPDFILYLAKNGKNRDIVYQIYVEPKSPNLLEQDAWKQRLLESIRPDKIQPHPLEIKTLSQNDLIKLYGVKFYTKINNKPDYRHAIKELKDILDNQ